MKTIKINGVEYGAEDIKKAMMGAIAINPEKVDLRDDNDWLSFDHIKEAYVFKTEGKLKLVAMPTNAELPIKSYRLINKHNLKKTQAVYTSARPAYVDTFQERPRSYSNNRFGSRY
jgi:hypothetical protein